MKKKLVLFGLYDGKNAARKNKNSVLTGCASFTSSLFTFRVSTLKRLHIERLSFEFSLFSLLLACTNMEKMKKGGEGGKIAMRKRKHN